jgi:hypothetical protein
MRKRERERIDWREKEIEKKREKTLGGNYAATTCSLCA